MYGVFVSGVLATDENSVRFHANVSSAANAPEIHAYGGEVSGG
jgi:hypothetical protein